MSSLMVALGRLTMRFMEEAGRTFLLLLRALATLRRRPYYLGVWFEQMLEVGNRSLPVVLVTAVFTGAVFALQTWQGLERFGATSMVAAGVALAITRELVPVLAALMVAGRVGSAMAAEIGTMVVTEQVDALRTLATDPIKYLVVPRLVATAVMLPALVMIGDMVGIYGGYLVVVRLLGAGGASYWQRTWQYLTVEDITGGLIKASFFGLLVALFGCARGFHTRGGAQGVGRATRSAVVSSSMAILISDFFLTKLLLAG